MPVAQAVLSRIPQRYVDLARKHRELVRFALVGSTTFVVELVVLYSLKWTVLKSVPVTAKIFAVVVATIVSYVLNREWSFGNRGGRERPHEAALFFVISGIGVGIAAAPMYISRYWLHLQQPHVSWFTMELADFFSGMILGTLLAMVFRWWGFRKWVFPDKDARPAKKPEVHTIIRTESARPDRVRRTRPATKNISKPPAHK